MKHRDTLLYTEITTNAASISMYERVSFSLLCDTCSVLCDTCAVLYDTCSVLCDTSGICKSYILCPVSRADVYSLSLAPKEFTRTIAASRPKMSQSAGMSASVLDPTMKKCARLCS